MIEAIKEYIFQNWILILVLGAFIVVLSITSFSSKKATMRYMSLLILIFLLSIVVFAEFYLPSVSENKTIRLILMAIRYSATPFVLALVMIVLVRRLRYFTLIPAAVLLVIDIVSIFNGIVFSINESNELVRGPLGYLPFIMCGLYMVFLIYILIKRSNKRLIEIVPIAFLSISLASGVIFPFIFGNKFAQIFCTIIVVSLFIYYVFDILLLVKKDSLTGLLNRQAYYVETRRDYKDITAIVSLDMNGLKKINDTYGHLAGDEALIALAVCFSKASRARESVYRMGGDEFVIVCRKTSKEDVEALVERIEKNVKETKYTCSIGYSYHEPGSIKLEDFLKESDEIMYANKADYYNNKN